MCMGSTAVATIRTEIRKIRAQSELEIGVSSEREKSVRRAEAERGKSEGRAWAEREHRVRRA